MNNELRIMPLRKFEVTYMVSVNQQDEKHTDVFTADYHNVLDGGRNVFYRTGNAIREYQYPLLRIVVTPVDDDTEIPK